MAGTPGKSGGARAGAGRKPKPPTVIAPEVAKAASGEHIDPRPVLEQIALGLIDVSPQQFKALTALLPYVHKKLGEGGKKEQDQEKAKAAGAGKFGARQPPKLVSSR